MVIFNNCMTTCMLPHVNSVCKSAFYHIRNISRIKKFLSMECTEILVHVFVSSRLDLSTATHCFMDRQNISYRNCNAHRMLLLTFLKYEHVTLHLTGQHWLPIEYHIQFKILLLTYKALNGLAPFYLSDLLQQYAPVRNLCSSYCLPTTTYKILLSIIWHRTFSVSAPELWNKLSLNVKLSSSTDKFKSALKTHLFKLAFL